MQEFITVIAVALIVYIVWLQLQLYISRRVIDSLQRTAVTIRQTPQESDGPNWRGAIVALIGIVVTLMVLANSARP
jgi:Ca2+/H+ antiporter